MLGVGQCCSQRLFRNQHLTVKLICKYVSFRNFTNSVWATCAIILSVATYFGSFSLVHLPIISVPADSLMFRNACNRKYRRISITVADIADFADITNIANQYRRNYKCLSYMTEEIQFVLERLRGRGEGLINCVST